MIDNITVADVIEYLTGSVTDSTGVSKARAKKAVLNALVYNIVVAEVVDRAKELLEGC